ncbi:HIT family protein [Candidatus Parcubacteria bacterium]|nr:MAG: HIT family protein [Candidatus Parcubacteria bacterium]
MYNHAPKDYKCPICPAVKGLENEVTYIKQTDLVYKDELVSAFINSFFIEGNLGHVIIVPNKHSENIYDMPEEYIRQISEVSKKIAGAMKTAYSCDGITTLQNNEPAGDQHAFHFHFHVFPRYKDDNLHANLSHKRLTTPEERSPYAEKLKEHLK